jgi:hypothetical protein
MQCCLPLMHAKLCKALSDAALAAVSGKPLALTALALGAPRPISVRHRVKCIDRLLGNPRLEICRHALYAAIARQWLGGLPQLLIVVDWSSLTADLQWHWLRASVVVEGRSVTLYEEVHPRQRLGNRAVHQRFLARLSECVPPCDQPPIVITDAGFRNPWFRLVARQGWHWIGRVRNRDFVRFPGSEAWHPAKHLYAKAASTAVDLGRAETVRNQPHACRLVLVKKTPQGRKQRYPSGKVQDNSSARKIARRYREPWLLSVSHALDHLDAQGIVNLYAQRMRIEEEFRDTKSLILGAGLSMTRSSGQRRLQALLLIGHVAQLTKRLIGEAAKAAQLHLHLTSTNRRARPELSVMTLARRVLDSPALLRTLKDPWPFRHALRSQVTRVWAQAVRL